MPIDEELIAAVHHAVVTTGQELAVEKQLLSLLAELSEGEVTAERRLQRIELIKDELVLQHRKGY